MDKQDYTKNTSGNMIKKLIFILGGLLLLVVLSYLMSVALTNRQFEREREERKRLRENPISHIQYDEILAGSIFNAGSKDYYVLIYDFDGVDNDWADIIVRFYRNSEDSKPLYTVNLGNHFNQHVIGDTSNSNARNASELSITGTTLINIKDGRIIYYIEGLEEINEHLE